MANIERRKAKDGSTSYRVKIRHQGHSNETNTFGKPTEARDWAQETEASIQAGRYLPSMEARKHTLSDLVDRYLKNVIPEKKSGKDQVYQLEWWRDRIGTYPLASVTAALISECRDELKQSGKSNATVNRFLAVLSHAFTLAEREWEWIDQNPFRKVSKLKEPRGRVRFLLPGITE